MRDRFLKLYLILFALIGITTLQAQTLNSASNLYKQGKYEEACDAFAKIIKGYRYNAPANQWYGVSLYKTGRHLEAEPYLKMASTRKVQESFRYLGLITLYDYRFDEAIDYFKSYKKMLEQSKQPTQWVDSCLVQAQVGERLMRGVETVQIIDSLVVDKAEFFKHYRLPSEAGRILSSDSFKQTKGEKPSTVFQTQRGERIIYGKATPDAGYDLVTQTQLLGDTWGEVETVDERINTPANESFPYMLADGKTLYFASDGAESVGGYDIFVTRLNQSTGKYLTPENVGMPFNSPYNDYMLAIDEVNHVGWFATDRYQTEDKVAIYTFIPNSEKEVYQGEDEVYRTQLARIDSIQQSWNDSTTCLALREKIASIPNSIGVSASMLDGSKMETNSIATAMHFILDDQRTYTSIRDFVNDEARDYYIKASELEREYTSLRGEIEELQQHYMQHPDDPNCRARILEIEQQLLPLYSSPERYYIQARNSEIVHLKTNN